MWHKIKMSYYCFMWKLYVISASLADTLRKEQRFSIEFRMTENRLYKYLTRRANYYFRKMLTCDLSDGCKRIVEKVLDEQGV